MIIGHKSIQTLIATTDPAGSVWTKALTLRLLLRGYLVSEGNHVVENSLFA